MATDVETAGWRSDTQGGTSNLNKASLIILDALPGSNFAPDAHVLLTSDGTIYENTSADYATPSWTARSQSSGQSGDMVYPLSATIGDYTAPSSYTLSSGSTSSSPDFTDNFDGADNWTDADSAKIGVDTVNDYLAFNAVRDGSNDACVYDYGAGNISDSAWVLRCRVRFSALGGAGNSMSLWIGISDLPQTTSQTGNQDFIGIQLIQDGAATYWSNDTDGAAPSAGSGDNSQSWTPATATNYYIEIKRISTTSYSCAVYTNSDFSTGNIGTVTGTCASTTASLRYFKIMNRVDASGGRAMTGFIDEVQFANGVSTMPTLKTTNSEANPNIYADFGSARDYAAFAIKLDRSLTTVTQIKIRCSTDTSFADGESVRTIDVTDFTDDTNRFILINRLSADARYVQIYGIGTGVLSLHFVYGRYGLTDAQWGRNHYHKKLNTLSVSSGVDSN